MLTYAARLRLVSSPLGKNVNIVDRVQRVLELLDLQTVSQKVIHERPCLRGVEGGEIRRLSIAIEILLFPSVILLEEPTSGLDTREAIRVMNQLQLLADSGHTVLCSLPKPCSQIFEMVDTVVVIAEGQSIYCGPVADVASYFSNELLNYDVCEGKEGLGDFLYAVCAGIERPKGYRAPLSVGTLVAYHQESDIYKKITDKISSLEDMVFKSDGIGIDSKGALNEKPTIVLFTSQSELTPLDQFFLVFCNYLNISVFLPNSVAEFYITVERAIVVKCREKEVIIKNLVSLIFTALLVGVLGYGTGDYGIYCQNLLTMPYAETFNCIAILFLMTSVLFSIQILNIHIVCQKLQIYRYERARKCCSLFSFWFATLLAEISFGLVYFLIYSCMVYFMTEMAAGYTKFLFFIALHAVITTVAVTTALAFAAFFRTEFVIRDAYLVWFFLMVMFSGYPVHIPYFFIWAQKLSILNPLKWAYQGTFVWKFENYVDHEGLLTTYGFNNFDKYGLSILCLKDLMPLLTFLFYRFDTFPILYRYISVSIAIFTLCLLPPLSLLRRRDVSDSKGLVVNDTASTVVTMVEGNDVLSNTGVSKDGNGFRSPSSRGAVLIPPAVFHRNTSITQNKSQSKSLTGNNLNCEIGTVSLKAPLLTDIENGLIDHKSVAIGHNAVSEPLRGPTIQFDHLSYTIEENTLTGGCISSFLSKSKDVLNNGMDAFMSTMRGEGLESDNRRNSYSVKRALQSETTISVSSSNGKAILNDISGHCDWGKLTFIMGKKDSG